MIFTRLMAAVPDCSPKAAGVGKLAHSIPSGLELVPGHNLKEANILKKREKKTDGVIYGVIKKLSRTGRPICCVQ